MITLRIFVMGLVALVPSKDGGQWTVLLKDMRQAHAMHVPVLIYDPDQRVCPSYPRGKKCRNGDGFEIARMLGRKGHGSPGILLDGKEISIVSPTVRESGKLASSDLGMFESLFGAVPGSPAELADTRWIPRMKDIEPDSSKVRSDYLAPNPNEEQNLLAGRMTLENGVLSTFSLADIGGYIRSMTFHKLGSGMMYGRKQAVADIVVFTVRVDARKVKIMMKPFGSGAPVYLNLKPRGDEPVDILLGNVSPLERSFRREIPAEHFSLYTRFSRAPKMAFDMAIPHVGWRRVARAKVEDAVIPKVIDAVNSYVSSGEEAEAPLRSLREEPEADGEGGTNRPICTAVIMEAADSASTVSAHPVAISTTMPDVERISQAVFSLASVTGFEFLCGKQTLFIGMEDFDTKKSRREARQKIGQTIFNALRVRDLSEFRDRFGLDLKIQSSEIVLENATRSKAAPMDKFRKPLVAGVSIGQQADGSAPGTLGMFVVNKEGNKDFFITAAHVVNGVTGGRICQPAPSDYLCSRPIGRASVVALESVDAALVRVEGIDRSDLANRVQFSGIRRVKCEDEEVQKYGRSTELTRAKIRGIGGYRVFLDDENSILVGGFSVSPWDEANPKDKEVSAPGDSGAIWFVTDHDNSIWGVGLHVGGEPAPEPGKEIGVAADLFEAFDELGLDLDKVSFPAPPNEE